jgi:hypothetical protein
VVQALAHWFPDLGIPVDSSPLPLPDPLTPEAFGRWLEGLIQKGPHQVLRLALWRAETLDSHRREAYRAEYRARLSRAGLPESYQVALPFRME